MGEVEQLVLALHSSREGRRRKAAEALRQRGEPGGQLSAQALIDMLMYDTIPLREAAADILRHWGEYVPLEPLFLAMQDAPKEVRSAVTWALADVGVCASPERLLPHLTDPDPMMRTAILSALGARAPVTSVLEALFDPDENLRGAAVFLVDLLREQIPVEPLISKLQDRDAPIRVLAARVLGRLGERIPREPLLKALHDAENTVRQEALSALVQSREQMPNAVLNTLLDDPDQSIHFTALYALGWASDVKALSLIVESLHVDNEWMREMAVARLQTYGQMQRIARHLPIEELLHLLKDEWWPVGHMAAELIATLKEQAPLTELLALVAHPLPQARHTALYTLALLGEQIRLSQCIPIEPLLSALEVEDVQTRQKAAKVLEFFEPPVPTDRLLPLLGEDDTDIALIVAKRGRQEGIDALLVGLRTMFNTRVALALRELGTRAPLEPLLAALSTSDTPSIQIVAETIYHTHPEILPSLVSELLETLRSGQVGPLLEPLRHILLLQSLVSLGSRESAVLRCFEEALDATHWGVRMWGAIGLSAMMPKEDELVLEKLRRLMDDPESAGVRQSARLAFEKRMPHITDFRNFPQSFPNLKKEE